MVIRIKSEQTGKLADIVVSARKDNNGIYAVCVNCRVFIEQYSELLLAAVLAGKEQASKLIDDFDKVSSVEDWYNESFLPSNPNKSVFDVGNAIVAQLNTICERNKFTAAILK